MNLPMVITAVLSDVSVNDLVQEGQNGIKNLKEKEEQSIKKVENKPKKPSGKGKPFEIKNVRVDARGIHGQVATAWVPHLQVNRILVIDSIAVKDDVQKMALKMAKPNSVKLSILTPEKAVERLNNKESYPDEKLLIIIQRIETLRQLANLNYQFETVNMGNVPNRPDTSSYQKTVHLTLEEVNIIKDLIQKGTQFTAQMVPNDNRVDFNEIINKKK